jgi:hypothetical protein
VAKAAPNNGVQATAVTLRFTPAPDAWALIIIHF